jgi:ABC-type glutathione transport system ATPase component
MMAKLGGPERNRSLESLLDLDKLGAAGKNAAPPALRNTVPSQGLEFSSLSYSVIKKQKKDGEWIKREAYLLNDISGQAVKGEIMAIMGPSGAGKSTFLDALAGRIAQGSLAGSVRIDGKPIIFHLLFFSSLL